MNRSELLPLLWKNDIPLEMRMMLCKLADLGVEIDEPEWDWPDFTSAPPLNCRHVDLIIPWRDFMTGEDIEEGDLVAINNAGEAVPIEEGMKLFVNGIEVEPGHRYRIGHDAVIYRRR